MLKMIKIKVIPTQNYMHVTYLSTILVFIAVTLIFPVKVACTSGLECSYYLVNYF